MRMMRENMLSNARVNVTMQQIAPAGTLMSSEPVLGTAGGAAGREYIVIEDSPHRAPFSFGGRLPIVPPATTSKRRLELQLDPVKIARNDAHTRDRGVREAKLQERIRMIQNEVALLEMRTLQYDLEKKKMLETWEQRQTKHLKQVVLHCIVQLGTLYNHIPTQVALMNVRLQQVKKTLKQTSASTCAELAAMQRHTQ
jgi:hypothetical protein